MNRPELIDTAPIPNDGGELRLFREGPHFAIKIAGGGELMHSRTHGSEDKLAEITCTRIAGRPQPSVLIGGLGMGFTLAAALKHLGSDASVVVAELVPAVVEWNRGPLGEHAGNPLQDPRTIVRVGDVAQVLKTEKQAFDAILLDVDNGPQGITHKSNDWLYSLPGLDAAMSALRPGGVLAIWSAGPDPMFTIRLKKARFLVEEVPVRAHGNKGARHLIWLAWKRESDSRRTND
ncbi:MAG: hypothetical protein IT466_08395 [Moraxellaceae bacterium]|jgi:spermidine synthase|nr:hypothetical protein [Moraxellaceae bacterium]MBP8852838.1 hypothetical protein [Moraxellaceae bacterium]MBP9730924.1 hypothetical protein [Moraxellaceae bacterium]MCC6200778.1 hypothetical protein [Moraxellaceae bacterium]HQX88892.1 hypothetical protein [Moraxellaceae bacterium]